ncbi:hypothetical protein P4U03_16635 [Bacillus mycoides]|uniref:Uncharacterized protein n=1 Tax=Bacillus thuringiensis serovar navarrensis TaxID=339658 RepID=A0A243A6S1_BACTU|nr:MULTISPECIES: hypothetical protein [Bacillus cereus group]MED1268207.1 hypothetical protein [Bacillus mycoides]OTY12399.1 hypothetical protein BK732_27345 [Bacillus thuringiensis serovar navarrensis]
MAKKMKAMPYELKQKLRQYNRTIQKERAIHEEIANELEKYGVTYESPSTNVDWSEVLFSTEALAVIDNCEGGIEENIKEIEEVFLHFVNKEN